MGLRDKLSENAALVTIVAVVLIGAAAFYVVRGFNEGTPDLAGTTTLWYADAATDELVAHGDLLPPVQSRGRTLVRAYVFSCTSCADASSRFLGYVEQFDNPARDSLARQGVTRYMGPKSLEQYTESEMDVMLPGAARQIRASVKTSWVNADDPKAKAIREAPAKKCGKDKTLVSCLGPAAP